MGKIGEGVGRYWPPTNSFLLLGVYTSVSNLVKIDEEMRPWECPQTDTHTRTDAKRFYYLSHAICYSYGADNKAMQQKSLCQSNKQSKEYKNSFYLETCAEAELLLLHLDQCHQISVSWSQSRVGHEGQALHTELAACSHLVSVIQHDIQLREKIRYRWKLHYHWVS